MIRPVAEQTLFDEELIFVLNWHQELLERVPLN